MDAICRYRFIVLVGLVGCTVESSLGSHLPGTYEMVVDAPAELRSKVDLLLVVDNSSNMQVHQQALASDFDYVMQRMYFGKGQIDLQVGVISSDLGVGLYSDAVPACTQAGDAARLLAASRCGIEGDAFLRIQRTVDGQVLSNLPGASDDQQLAAAMACMAELGESGCDYEQPLEAMRTAFDSGELERSGFLRHDSVLGLVVLTDEDDCSVRDPSLFDPNHPDFVGDAPAFRCFRSGVVCEGDDVVVRPGERDGCIPRENSRYSQNISTYVDAVIDARPDPRDRVVSTIIGDPNRVAVELDAAGDDAQLVAACAGASGAEVFPAVRLGAFSDAFGEQGSQSPLCHGGSLHPLLSDLRQNMGTTCLSGDVLDTDPLEPGRQVDCYVFQEIPEVADSRTFFPRCDNPGNLLASSQLPCFTIQTGGEACGDFETQLAIQIHGRTGAGHRDSRLRVMCKMEDS